MSSPKRRRVLLSALPWNRENISWCSCSDSKSKHAHVHCPCDSCRGKVVSRPTEYRHWTYARDYAQLLVVDANSCTESNASYHSLDAEQMAGNDEEEAGDEEATEQDLEAGHEHDAEEESVQYEEEVQHDFLEDRETRLVAEQEAGNFLEEDTYEEEQESEHIIEDEDSLDEQEVEQQAVQSQVEEADQDINGKIRIFLYNFSMYACACMLKVFKWRIV